jgi:hypothetical protein
MHQPSNTSDLRRRRRNEDTASKREHLFNSQSAAKNNNNNNSTRKNEGSTSSRTNTSRSDEESKKAITSSLMRTKQMMQSELQRVSDVSSTIQDDGKKIQNTQDQHKSMGHGVKGAKFALVWLKVKEKEDSIIFWSAVSFFFAVVLYVVWTRIRIPFLLW